jgi:hypothetical protein
MAQAKGVCDPGRDSHTYTGTAAEGHGLYTFDMAVLTELTELEISGRERERAVR